MFTHLSTGGYEPTSWSGSVLHALGLRPTLTQEGLVNYLIKVCYSKANAENRRQEQGFATVPTSL